jgi:hypothetical protein
MNGVTGDPKAVRAEFADAAQFVLQQRVRKPSIQPCLRGRLAALRRDLPPPDRGSGIEPQTSSEEIVASDGGSIAFLSRGQLPFLRMREAACPATLVRQSRAAPR